MAQELAIQIDPFLETGLTLIAKVFSKGGVQQGSDVSLTEASSGFYVGDFDLSTLADGEYAVRFETTTELYGTGELKILDGAESADARQAILIAEHDATQAAISGLNNLSASQVNAEVDTALADYGTAKKTELVVINDGVKSASILVPHSQDLP